VLNKTEHGLPPALLFDMQAKKNDSRAAAQDLTEVRGWLQLWEQILNTIQQRRNALYEIVGSTAYNSTVRQLR
jgi:hypothetical protein